MRTAVYTAIFGGYDALHPQPIMPGVDLVCFTDDDSLRSDQWDIRVVRPRHKDPRLSAKWFKLHPHRALRSHQRSVWIDGGVVVERPDFPSVVLGAMSDDGLSLFTHPVRSTIRDEAEFCVSIPKYGGLPLVAQVDHYYRKGFPDTSGLWAGGIIGREHNKGMGRLGRLWWRENKRWTYQDQLSLPYVLWRLGIRPGVIPSGLWDGDLLTMREHRHPDR